MFVMYVRANSSILISVFTVTCRTNPVKVPGVIFRLCPLAWPTGLQGQVNPLASSENHCSKDSFRARRCRLPFEPFLSRLNWFVSLGNARMIEAWRVDYNSVRPHSSLDYLTPEEFATSAAKRAASPPTPLVPTIPAGVQTILQKNPNATL